MSAEAISLKAGQAVTVTDHDGNRYERVIEAIHYPSTLDGKDCLIVMLSPTPGRTAP